MATELRRSGASAPATASFLVATPETGIDSVSVSYTLLGPIFAIYRPFAAIMSAIISGLLVSSIMMAGPATNISTLGVIKNEMAGAVLILLRKCNILTSYYHIGLA